MTNDTFHEHDTRQGKEFRLPLARSNQRSRAMRCTGVKINNHFINHMGYNGSLAMFKKEVKKFIIENDVSLSCLWCLINIIHWICYFCNLLYSATIVRKCSLETSGCVVVPSRHWPAPSQCMSQRLLINKRTKNKGGSTKCSWYKELCCICRLHMCSAFNVFACRHVHWSKYDSESLG